ncbi:universal stress protein [Actinacidiphila soli]|uniref:universal stress protein n=1 Tax=Actinacidiphila soli TaxID=2487275 RepID=UPI0013E2FF73|nr:universal stress protein [Actinacidiphila soli]
MPLRLVNAWSGEPQLDLPPEPEAAWHHGAERALRAAQAELAIAYPDLAIAAEQVSGFPAGLLVTEAERAQMLMLGCREVGSVAGFFLGSTGMELAATVSTPVVLVRADNGDASGAR